MIVFFGGVLLPKVYTHTVDDMTLKSGKDVFFTRTRFLSAVSGAVAFLYLMLLYESIS